MFGIRIGEGKLLTERLDGGTLSDVNSGDPC
jgi:hypothetical protein